MPSAQKTGTDRSALPDSARPELPCARLVQISDPHLLRSRDDLHRTVNTSVSFEHVLSSAAPLIRDADAVLLTGDIAQDEKADTYARLARGWIDEWVGADTPVWCLPGNHDAPLLMQVELKQPPFVYLGHHELGNWEVVMLDSRNPGKASGLLGVDQLDRLAQRLEQSHAAHVLIVLHHHPLPLGSSWLDCVGLEDRDAFERTIHGKRVRGVVFGHIHQVVDRVVENVRYLGCPSTCVQFTPHQTEFGLDMRPPGFRTLSLYPSGDIRTDVIWLRHLIPHDVSGHTETASA